MFYSPKAGLINSLHASSVFIGKLYISCEPNYELNQPELFLVFSHPHFPSNLLQKMNTDNDSSFCLPSFISISVVSDFVALFELMLLQGANYNDLRYVLKRTFKV